MVSSGVGGRCVPVENVIEMFSVGIFWLLSCWMMEGRRMSIPVCRNESETTSATVSVGAKCLKAWWGSPMGSTRVSMSVCRGSGRDGEGLVSTVSRYRAFGTEKESVWVP